MPRRRDDQAFETLFAQEKARILEQEGRARAGLEGQPPMSQRPNRQLEDDAWTAADPNVTSEHLAQIAQATVQELMADKDPTGRPRWTLEDIENEVKFKQSMAVYPWRHKTFLTGHAEDDWEAHARDAERMAKRHQQTAALGGGGWEEVDESEVLSAPPGGQEMTQPAAPGAGTEGY